MKRLRLLLTVATIGYSSVQVNAMDPEQYMHMRLEESSPTSKTLVVNDEYKNPSSINYRSKYPKMPRIHGAESHLGFDSTYLSLEIPSQVLNDLPDTLISQIFKDVPRENISLFFVAQRVSDSNGSVALIPNYYVDNNINSYTYNSNTSVSVALFPIMNPDLTLGSQPAGTLITANISTHPSYGDIVATVPSSLKLSNFKKENGDLFASFTKVNASLPAQRKAAITLHYVPHPDHMVDVLWAIQHASSPIDIFNVIESEVEGEFGDEFNKSNILGLLKNLGDSLELQQNFLCPDDFNPHVYLVVNPGVRIEYQKDSRGMDLETYAKWQYANFGAKNGVPYTIPADFDANVYIEVNPGVRIEHQQNSMGMDLVTYAQWQYANFGAKDGAPYRLPADFNPHVYLVVNPGVRIEHQRNSMGMELEAYAKWQYANFGAKDGAPYTIPADFDANVYIEVNPGVRIEHQQNSMGMDLVTYAQWQYANFGAKDGVPYKHA